MTWGILRPPFKFTMPGILDLVGFFFLIEEMCFPLILFLLLEACQGCELFSCSERQKNWPAKLRKRNMKNKEVEVPRKKKE